MRPIAFAALMPAMLAVSSLATPSLGQTVTAAGPVRTAEASMTIHDGDDAGPATQPLVLDGAQAEDAGNVTDLPRIATHAPTPLGLRLLPGDSQ